MQPSRSYPPRSQILASPKRKRVVQHSVSKKANNNPMETKLTQNSTTNNNENFLFSIDLSKLPSMQTSTGIRL